MARHNNFLSIDGIRVFGNGLLIGKVIQLPEADDEEINFVLVVVQVHTNILADDIFGYFLVGPSGGYLHRVSKNRINKIVEKAFAYLR